MESWKIFPLVKETIFKPQLTNMEPTKITYLEMNMIWTKPPGNYVPWFHVSLQGF